MSDVTPAITTHCAGCRTELAPSLLACPVCRRLVHGETLADLARDAERLESSGRIEDAVTAWRRALELLPADAPQAETIRTRVDGLTKRAESAATKSSPVPTWLAPLGVLGLALWKFKFLIALVLSKGKLLLLGLTKSSTLFSMLAAMGVYWTLWGWKFAVGFVLAIYVHEMGHVAALARLGIRATAPMFLPGIGAVVRMDQYPASAREDARVGLAGPIWGLGAALATFAAWRATGQPIFAALTHAGALINLFNLIPVWQLDGARGLRALARPLRLAIAVLVTGAFLATGEGTLLLVGLGMWWRVFDGTAPAESDTRAAAELALLVVTLTALTRIDVPGLARE